MNKILEEQIAYYRARAVEYDDWFLRKGRYDHGPEQNAKWFKEVEEVQYSLDRFKPTGKILELACGTGWWTASLAKYTDHLTAVDASPEMLAINRQRMKGLKVEYIQTDIFQWKPKNRYDVVFFGFWLSHVPPEKFKIFWDLVQSCLNPHGRIFFVDSLRSETSGATDHQIVKVGETMSRRKLNSGQEFCVVKVFYEPDALTAKLKDFGWKASVSATTNYFLYGSGKPI